MHPIFRSIAVAAALGFLGSVACSAGESGTWQSSVTRASRKSPDARIVVLDLKSGRLIAAHRFNEAARTLAAPGSTLKPLVLYSLIEQGRWDPARRIACNGQLVVAGHRLACSHPPAPPFDARQALTWSCNTYFAGVAGTLAPAELSGILSPTGLLGLTGLAPNEAAAEFREPHTVADEQLAVLGVSGIRVSPLELAVAYRWLALQLQEHSGSTAAQVVRSGLEDSASFGMAGEASLGGMAVAGKTGTAEDTASARTHGWFAGLASARHPQVVIVIFAPAGRGADAAHIAGEITALASQVQP